MKLSKYTLLIEDFPTPDESLLYNTLTQAEVEVNREVKEFLKSLGEQDNPFKSVRDQSGEALEILQKLETLGIVVQNDVDELKLVERFFDEIRYSTSIMEIMVMTTYLCNFGCVYCVEDGVKEDIKLDRERTRKIIDWIATEVEKVKPEELRIAFYGGEPLLNILPMVEISCSLSKLCEEKDITFMTTITTNGALLTPETVDRLTPYGLTAVKVTIDGDRDAHNRKRPFLGGKGSFDSIIRNIESVVDRIAVAIDGNFDEENVETIPRLLDYLEERGLKEKIAQIDFGIIGGTVKETMERLGGSDIRSPRLYGQGGGFAESWLRNYVSTKPHSTRESACTFCSIGSRLNLPRRLFEMKKELVGRGFKTRLGLGMNGCGAIMRNSGFIIDPLGRIYKCPGLVGWEEFVVGDAENNKLGEHHMQSEFVDAWKKSSKCLDCAFLPLCGGGCQHSVYTTYGRFGETDCLKEFFETIGPEMLKLEYEVKLKDESITEDS